VDRPDGRGDGGAMITDRLTLGQLRALPLPDNTLVAIDGRTVFIPTQRATVVPALRVRVPLGDGTEIYRYYRSHEDYLASGTAETPDTVSLVVVDTSQVGLYSK
jgi:hypothetical protein